MRPTVADEDPITRRDALDSFLKFADDMRDIREHYERPSIEITCPCGGSLVVGRDVPAPERKRHALNFRGAHYPCTRGEAGDAGGKEG